MRFPMAGPGYKEKKDEMILLVSLGRKNKDEDFKPADKRLIMNLI